MQVAFITTVDPQSQGDYMEVSMLHGLRQLLGDDCIDMPPKKIMYGDFSESPKNELHGWGFSLLSEPIQEVSLQSRSAFLTESIFLKEQDYVVLYGCTDAYGMDHDQLVNANAKAVWYLDGHDHTRIAPNRKPCFKREMISKEEGVYSSGFGIPEHRIMDINLNKTQLIAQTYPPYAVFGPQILGRDARQLYKFTNEDDYYQDMANSWFSLSCLKGGWQSLRNLEIIAAGSLLMFRDFDKWPLIEEKMPAVSYSSMEHLQSIVSRLLKNDGPTQEYVDLLMSQREWLINNATTIARAKRVMEVICSTL